MPNKTIVITGASSGIGEALALRLARDGFQLAIAARRRPELERVAERARLAGSPKVLVVEADVTSRGDIERVSREAVAVFGSYDVWVNNAGRGITRHVLDLSADDIDEMISINLKSALYGMQIAAKQFIAQDRGQIINVSSFLGRVPLATHRSAYNAAKAALNALTANLRMDLRAAHPNVKVTLVMPGMVGTEFGRNALGSAPDTPVYAGPHVQNVADVADIIAGAIANPVAEVYTNPASPEMARRYFADVDAYEASGGAWGSEPGRTR
jgi:short-subunit dehydrogenase